MRTVRAPIPLRTLLSTALAAVTVSALAVLPQAGAMPASAPADRDQAGSAQQPYLVGRGIADVTGEPAEAGMMGYARLEQRTSGVHQRQRSRAFVVADPATKQRVAMVTADVGMIFGDVRDAVLQQLSERHGSAYNAQNVMLTGTHTHSGPGGFSHYTLYNITTMGYHGKTFDALVNGIVESIEKADADLAPGSLSTARGELTGASINRSKRAFDRNPAEDKQHFPGGIDPTTTLLRMERDGKPVGAMNWFATHATSMSPDNTLISGDNKGYAAYRWEHDVAGTNYREPDPGFVAAFAQSNSGDMSPNLALKPGTGPTNDEFANTQIIGQRQFDAASKLMQQPGNELQGGVDSRLSYVDMSQTPVRPEFTGDGQTHKTCKATLGASFAAGAEDGPGPTIFHEGAGMNPFFGAISKNLYKASPELKACQSPKEILLAPGELGWTPKVLPIQLIRIGSLHLVSLPQEPTVVSGLRLRETVAQQLGVSTDDVLVAGYANDYAGYLTTPEEYDQQDYEGGHTMFGRWQLPAYQQEFARIAADMKAGRPSDRGPSPSENPEGGKIPLQPGVVADAPQIGKQFGDVLEEPNATYQPGQQARTVFASAHPNNDLHTGGTYLEVQRREGSNWVTVADDGDWSTKFQWARDGIAASKATVTWDIPKDAQAGTYRIVHHGDAKALGGKITPFDGTSREFAVG